jgi:hypothetical protein
MAKILELQEKLLEVAKKERSIFSGDTERQFFIELFSASSVDELLEKFTPSEHNSDWDVENQKVKQNSADIDKIIKARRAIAYMQSGKQCIFKHYKETELTAYIMGKARQNWTINELEQLKQSQDEGQSIWIAKK